MTLAEWFGLSDHDLAYELGLSPFMSEDEVRSLARELRADADKEGIWLGTRAAVEKQLQELIKDNTPSKDED